MPLYQINLFNFYLRNYSDGEGSLEVDQHHSLKRPHINLTSIIIEDRIINIQMYSERFCDLMNVTRREHDLNETTMCNWLTFPTTMSTIHIFIQTSGVQLFWTMIFTICVVY